MKIVPFVGDLGNFILNIQIIDPVEIATKKQAVGFIDGSYQPDACLNRWPVLPVF